MYVKIIEDKCTGCGLCAQICPVEAIFETDNGKYYIDDGLCISCLACERNCNYNAIEWGYDEDIKKEEDKVGENKENKSEKIKVKIKTPEQIRRKKIKKILRFIVEDTIAPVLEKLFLLFIDGAERLFKKDK